jgi:hypothetical protein
MKCNISFMHIPKTGGISFKHSFYLEDLDFCCEGHFSLEELKKCRNANNHTYITFIRDPFDLAISNYFYKVRYEHFKVKIEDYLESYDGMYIHYLKTFDDLNFVGMVEKYNRSVWIFNKMFNTNLRVLFDNVNPEKPVGHSYKIKYNKELFIKNNEKEYEIYNRGVEKFNDIYRLYC